MPPGTCWNQRAKNSALTLLRLRNAPLRSCLRGIHVARAGINLESQHPIAGDAVAVPFRRRESPQFCGFQRAVRKIAAGSGSVERRCGHPAGFIHVDSDVDPHFPANGVTRSLRSVWQELLQHFSAYHSAARCCRCRDRLCRRFCLRPRCWERCRRIAARDAFRARLCGGTLRGFRRERRRNRRRGLVLRLRLRGWLDSRLNFWLRARLSGPFRSGNCARPARLPVVPENARTGQNRQQR
jgi:hypothetical protein